MNDQIILGRVEDIQLVGGMLINEAVSLGKSLSIVAGALVINEALALQFYYPVRVLTSLSATVESDSTQQGVRLILAPSTEVKILDDFRS